MAFQWPAMAFYEVLPSVPTFSSSPLSDLPNLDDPAVGERLIPVLDPVILSQPECSVHRNPFK